MMCGIKKFFFRNIAPAKPVEMSGISLQNGKTVGKTSGKMDKSGFTERFPGLL